jgi:hypothetical protein
MPGGGWGGRRRPGRESEEEKGKVTLQSKKSTL